ncbi:methyltransferase-like protein 24 [Aplysia californica]|uniref:Methyltransferase-like protein 24 n=1 Tax=Aplysia californica TaxID=6500 RepID=A0ABM0K2D1_APLCA|nr:methyltransferase-like protein 24 [Aplysia californica]
MTGDGKMLTGFLPSRKMILVASVVLLAASFLLYTSAMLATRYRVPAPELIVQTEMPKVRKPVDVGLAKHTTGASVKAKVETEVLRDVVDNSKARSYLKRYNDLFNKNEKNLKVNPNDPSSIKTWWQAAAMIDWYINSPIRYRCKNRVAFGNWHVCQDEPYLVKKPCLVYSFGINFDFSFDDAMGKIGCEVHSFDPSMNTSDHKRNDNVTFHNMGLGSSNSDAFNPRRDMYVQDNQKWRMRTLKSVVQMLKHEQRVIDVLKIDVEGHEWAVMENMMETDMFQYVRQFMLEYHLFPTWPAKEDYVHLYKLYTKLREMGLREFAIGPHPKTLKVDKFNNQGDSEYINYFFKRKENWRS